MNLEEVRLLDLCRLAMGPLLSARRDTWSSRIMPEGPAETASPFVEDANDNPSYTHPRDNKHEVPSQRAPRIGVGKAM